MKNQRVDLDHTDSIGFPVYGRWSSPISDRSDRSDPQNHQRRLLESHLVGFWARYNDCLTAVHAFFPTSATNLLDTKRETYSFEGRRTVASAPFCITLLAASLETRSCFSNNSLLFWRILWEKYISLFAISSIIHSWYRVQRVHCHLNSCSTYHLCAFVDLNPDWNSHVAGRTG